MSVKDFALQCFREVDKQSGDQRHENFLREYKRLMKFAELSNPNDVGCFISKDCSLNGCYRYFMCDFKRKRIEE